MKQMKQMKQMNTKKPCPCPDSGGKVNTPKVTMKKCGGEVKKMKTGGKTTKRGGKC